MSQARFYAALIAASFATPALSAGVPFPLGAYMGNPDGNNPAAEAAFEANFTSLAQTLHTPPSMIVSYIDYTQPVSGWVGNTGWQAWSNSQSKYARNLIPILGLPMASIAPGHDTSDAQFQAFASGANDSVIQGIVAAWAQVGFHQMIVRVGWEMNCIGNTFVGFDAQSQSDWVAAFRHIYVVLHAAAQANNVSLQVAWNPNISNYDAVPTLSLYPGDGYTDIIAADGYADMHPYSDGGSNYHDWHTGGEDSSVAQFIADPINRRHYWNWPAATAYSKDGSGGHNFSYDVLLAFTRAHHKPFAVAETGSGNCWGGNDVCDEPTFPRWLLNKLSNAASRGTPISFVDIWNCNAGGNYEFSFASDNKPSEAGAWRQSFGAH